MESMFELFGQQHLLALATVLAFSIGVPFIIKSGCTPAGQNLALWILASVLILYVVVGFGVRVGLYDLAWKEHLPLHLCGAAAVLSAAMIWLRSYRLFEIVYFWGVAGSLAALLTPDLLAGFPHPFFLLFFLGHGLTLCAVMTTTLVLRFRPQPQSIVRALLAAALYAALIFPINLLLGSNYLYLMAKPNQASLLDLFGPWPWYYIGLAISAIVGCVLVYIPFALRDLFKQ